MTEADTRKAYRRKLRQHLYPYMKVKAGKSFCTNGYLVTSVAFYEIVAANDKLWQLVKDALNNGYSLKLIEDEGKF